MSLKRQKIPFAAPGPWKHLELGGGNPGAIGGMKPEVAYATLLETLDLLYEKVGPEGLFILNDVEPAAVRFAADVLRKHCREQGWDKIQIQEFAADLKTTSLPAVTTAHFKYPTEQVFGAPISKKGIALLKQMAGASKIGLTFISDLDFGIKHLSDPELLIEPLPVEVPEYESGDKRPSQTPPRAFQILLKSKPIAADPELATAVSEEIVPEA